MCPELGLVSPETSPSTQTDGKLVLRLYLIDCVNWVTVTTLEFRAFDKAMLVFGWGNSSVVVIVAYPREPAKTRKRHLFGFAGISALLLAQNRAH